MESKKISQEQIKLIEKNISNFTNNMYELFCDRLNIVCLEDIESYCFNEAIECIEEVYEWGDTYDAEYSKKD